MSGPNTPPHSDSENPEKKDPVSGHTAQPPSNYSAPHEPSSWDPSGPGPKDGGSKRGLIIGIVAGAVLLVLLVVLALFAISGSDANDEETGEEETGDESATGSPASPSQAESPSDAVELYLNALADGDFDTALSFIDNDPRNTSLTDEVLTDSLELAPITDIDVDDVGENFDTMGELVTFGYQLGDRSFDGELRVSADYDTGEWFVRDYDMDITAQASSIGPLTLIINGEEAPRQGATLLWGLAYDVGLGHENFEFSTLEDGLLVLDDTFVRLYGSDIQLTAEAEDQWRTLVQDEIATCIDSSALEAGCGLSIPGEVSGHEVVDGTVERSLATSTQETINSLQPTHDYTNPNLVTTNWLGGVNVEYDCVEGGQEGRCELLFGDATDLGRATVNMNSDEPEITWE